MAMPAIYTSTSMYIYLKLGKTVELVSLICVGFGAASVCGGLRSALTVNQIR